MSVLESISFASTTAGVIVDDAAYLRDEATITPAPRNYIVLYSARSGSTWLRHALTATGRFGKPGEYLNPNHIAGVAHHMNAATPARMLAMLRRRRQTTNGVFGLFVRHVDIQALGTDIFEAEFADKAVFFHLWRRDLVAQAVSLYRAVASGRFHSISTAGSLAPPDYDAAQIGQWLAHLAATENGNVRLLARFGVGARHLCYEEISTDRTAVLAAFAQVLAVNLSPEPPSPTTASAKAAPEKIGDDWNEHATARFRAEQPALIAATEAARLIDTGIANHLPPAPEAPIPRAAWEQGRQAGLAGHSPFQPPEANRRAWHAGWQHGWNGQKQLKTEAAPEPPRRRHTDKLPPDLPEEILRLPENRPPRALAGFTARRLADILADQERRAVTGGLLELGLSRGRQTRVLLAAAARTGEPLVTYAAGHSRLAGALGPWLRAEEPTPTWTLHDGLPDDEATLRADLGGAARCIALEPARFGPWVIECLPFAARLLGPDSCILLAGFLETDTLAVTEAVITQTRPAGLLPVALLPGRLLLCPAAIHPRYTEMVKAFALRDAQQTGAGKIAVALRKNDTTRLSQTLCGTDLLVLG